MLRCYTSRVENGHTVPSVETLEKYARALGIPMYRLFYESNKPPEKLRLNSVEVDWGLDGTEFVELRAFARLLARMDDSERRLLLGLAQKMAGRKRRLKSAD
jgi:transcriptional regulator with XRE-family HTH domain